VCRDGHSLYRFEDQAPEQQGRTCAAGIAKASGTKLYNIGKLEKQKPREIMWNRKPQSSALWDYATVSG
jgi:hypothetical protein